MQCHVRGAGDSHTVALTERGALYGWGTFRDGSGVMGFSDAERIQLVPALVYQPPTADTQVVKVVSGEAFLPPTGVAANCCSAQQLSLRISVPRNCPSRRLPRVTLAKTCLLRYLPLHMFTVLCTAEDYMERSSQVDAFSSRWSDNCG